MKPLLALLATALLSAGAYACGGAATGAHSASHVSTSAPAKDSTTAASSESPLADTTADSDRDNDVGAPDDDTRNTSALDFGHAADASERRTITAFVKRYYAAALAQDGATGCSMIYSTLAEAIPEDYSQTPGVPYMHGAKTCAAAMTLLFKHYHPLLVLEVPKLDVRRVGLEERQGLVLLSFGRLPERTISVKQEGRKWKMSALLDVELQ
jgi:hypothetical protein